MEKMKWVMKNEITGKTRSQMNRYCAIIIAQ